MAYRTLVPSPRKQTNVSFASTSTPAHLPFHAGPQTPPQSPFAQLRTSASILTSTHTLSSILASTHTPSKHKRLESENDRQLRDRMAFGVLYPTNRPIDPQIRFECENRMIEMHKIGEDVKRLESKWAIIGPTALYLLAKSHETLCNSTWEWCEWLNFITLRRYRNTPNNGKWIASADTKALKDCWTTASASVHRAPGRDKFLHWDRLKPEELERLGLVYDDDTGLLIPGRLKDNPKKFRNTPPDLFVGEVHLRVIKFYHNGGNWLDRMHEIEECQKWRRGEGLFLSLEERMPFVTSETEELVGLQLHTTGIEQRVGRDDILLVASGADAGAGDDLDFRIDDREEEHEGERLEGERLEEKRLGEERLEEERLEEERRQEEYREQAQQVIRDEEHRLQVLQDLQRRGEALQDHMYRLEERITREGEALARDLRRNHEEKVRREEAHLAEVVRNKRKLRYRGKGRRRGKNGQHLLPKFDKKASNPKRRETPGWEQKAWRETSGDYFGGRKKVRAHHIDKRLPRPEKSTYRGNLRPREPVCYVE